MIVDDLTQLSNDDLASRSLGAFPKLALWLLRDARDSVVLLNNFEFWTPSMIELDRARSGPDRLEVLIRYMFQVIDPVHLDTLRAKIRTLGAHSEEAAMNIAEYLHEEGRLEKGLEKGRIDTLRDLLVFKFQSLDAADEARLQAATPQAIDRYLRRMLTADSLAAVFED
jgi:hypothetical protein